METLHRAFQWMAQQFPAHSLRLRLATAEQEIHYLRQVYRDGVQRAALLQKNLDQVGSALAQSQAQVAELLQALADWQAVWMGAPPIFGKARIPEKPKQEPDTSQPERLMPAEVIRREEAAFFSEYERTLREVVK